MSFTNLNFGYIGWKFVGFDNYTRLFSSTGFLIIVKNTFVYVLFVVVFQLVIGLAVAMALNVSVPGRQFVRSVVILPWVVPAVVSALVFTLIFGGSRMSISNYALSLIGMRPVSWLSDATMAMGLLIFVSVWRAVPFVSLIMLGGLQTLPSDVYEAAIIDGTNRWQRFWYVTLPLLKPMLLISLIMATAHSLNSLDTPLALTGGGPGNATEVLSISLYRQAFMLLDAGYGAAIGTLMLLVNIVLIAFYLRLVGPKRRAEAE
ncbi:carbohydrate ABC transporter permease [Agrobacterium tumefaciens]|uniref:carbohydrate ABC transporter permease n=1 Tax=Agrobacterium tumefaciens TaxID=358 RepID=UPI001885E9B1|nr:sugar ABC transporter permease [Agrobacterium tumefaciens]